MLARNSAHGSPTRAPQVGLEFHFAVEQRARSFLGQFFNFNGTAGVWRIKAINDAGGWESDTGGCCGDEGEGSEGRGVAGQDGGMGVGIASLWA